MAILKGISSNFCPLGITPALMIFYHRAWSVDLCSSSHGPERKIIASITNLFILDMSQSVTVCPNNYGRIASRAGVVGSDAVAPLSACRLWHRLKTKTDPLAKHSCSWNVADVTVMTIQIKTKPLARYFFCLGGLISYEKNVFAQCAELASTRPRWEVAFVFAGWEHFAPGSSSKASYLFDTEASGFHNCALPRVCFTVVPYGHNYKVCEYVSSGDRLQAHIQWCSMRQQHWLWI